MFLKFILVVGTIILLLLMSNGDIGNIARIYPKEIVILIICFILGVLFLPINSIQSSIKKRNKISLKNLPNDFENLYKNLYDNCLINLEGKRKKIKLFSIIECILLTVPLVIFISQIYSFITKRIEINYTVYIVYIVICVLMLIISDRINKKYYDSKKEIHEFFVKSINNNLNYKPKNENYLSVKEDYKKAKFDKEIINKIYNNIYTGDYIYGYLEKVHIKLNFLKTENVSRSYYNSKSHTERYEKFQGIFATIKLDKMINSYIKINKNKLNILDNNTKVEIDDEKFNKYFDMHSDDKEMATKIINYSIIQAFVEFYEKYGIDFDFIIREDTVYIRFYTNKIFKPSIFSVSKTKENLFTYYCILQFITELTDKVNKNI